MGLRDAIEVEMLRFFKQGNPLEPHKDSWGQQFNWVLVRESVGRWCVRLEHYDPAVSEVQSSSLPVPILRGWWWWLKAACGVAWTTPKFTDFVLPLALAAMAPVVSIWFYFAACPACVDI